jgi:hypothetical protein
MPEVKITSSVNGTFASGSDIIIKTETNSAVKKVEFFLDDVSAGYDTKAPFSWVLFNTSEGIHTLKVIAANLNGKTKTVTAKITVKAK